MPVGSFPYVSEILLTRVQMTKDFWLNWFLMYLLLSNNMSVCGGKRVKLELDFICLTFTIHLSHGLKNNMMA